MLNKEQEEFLNKLFFERSKCADGLHESLKNCQILIKERDIKIREDQERKTIDKALSNIDKNFDNPTITKYLIQSVKRTIKNTKTTT